MSLINLKKKQANRVIGIDASTKSIAYAIFEGGKAIKCGEINLVGQTVFLRAKDAKKKVRALMKHGDLIADYIVIEAAFVGKNPGTAIDLAYVYGSIISELMDTNPEVHKVAPITWQTAIGNPNLKQHEKDQIKKANPGRKPSFYQAEGRNIRKQRTLDFARKYFTISSDSDNIGDAIGLAFFASHNLTRH